MAAEDVLAHPKQQRYQTEQDLRVALPQVVVEHILNLTETTCQTASATAWRRITSRLEEIGFISKKKPSSSEEATIMRKRLFRLMSPDGVARDLQPVLAVPQLEKTYLQELEAVSQILPAPQLVNRYRFSEQDLERVYRLTVNAAERAELIQRLKQYGQNVKELSRALRSLKERRERSAGARLAGSLAGALAIPIPFIGSRAGRWIADTLTGTTDARQRVEQSAERLDEGWSQLGRAVAQYAEAYEERLRLVVLSLFSGLYLGLQRDLQQFGFTFKPGDEPGTFGVGVTPERSRRLLEIYGKTESAVVDHLKARDWDAADKVAGGQLRLFAADMASRYVSHEGDNLYYRAYMLRHVCTFSRAARLWEAGDRVAAGSAWIQAFGSSDYLISDLILQSLSGPHDTSWCAAVRLATLAEELRLNGRTSEADRLLELPLEYYERCYAKREGPLLAGESISLGLQGWCQLVYGFLKQSGYRRDSLEELLDEKKHRGDVVYPALFFWQGASPEVRRSPLGQYLQRRLWKHYLGRAALVLLVVAAIAGVSVVAWSSLFAR